jgi:serine/threonine protein kinase
MKLCLLCSGKYDDSVSVCKRDGARLVSAGQDNLINSIVGDRYFIDELIGKGSVGRVYKAHRVSDESDVVLKVLRENLSNDEEALARFKREAQMLSIIEHPNIVVVYDFGQTPAGEPYFAAEFLDGKTLAAIISEKRCLTISEAEPIFEQVCKGLAEAHSHGFIHRDIKPTNIMLMQGEHEFVAKILDFSLAKLPPLAVEDKVTKDGMLRGTPAYMSPEQCQSMEVDNRSDIYSLAVVVFETLTGSRPFFSKNSVITMHQQMNDPAPQMMAVRKDLFFCEDLETLLQQCLSKKPSDRPETVEQFWQKFSAACEAQRIAVEKGTSVGYVPSPTLEAITKLTPLEAFRAAEQRRDQVEKILGNSVDDEAASTIRLSKEELESQRQMAAVQRESEIQTEVASAISQAPSKQDTFLASMLASPLGRKILLGTLGLVLLIILVSALLFVPIPGPNTP